MKWLDGLHSYDVGNTCLGFHLTLRNIGDNKSNLIRRYIRVQIRIFGSVLNMEYRFPNSI